VTRAPALTDIPLPKGGVFRRLHGTDKDLSQCALWDEERFLLIRGRGETRAGTAVAVALNRRRKGNQAVSVHAQHCHTAWHILPPFVRPYPAEPVADDPRERGSGQRGIRCDEPTDVCQLSRAEAAPAVPDGFVAVGDHGGAGSSCCALCAMASRTSAERFQGR
jgi:hypothetical protein